MQGSVITIGFSPKRNKTFMEKFRVWSLEVTNYTTFVEASQFLSKDDLMLVAINAEKQTIYDTQAMVRHIRSGSYVPIIVIAQSKNEEAVLEDGADICFPASISDGPLLAHAMAIIRRYALYDSGHDLYDRDLLILRRGDLLIERQKHKVTQSEKAIELTRKEYRLLVQFALHPGIVLESEQIAEMIWLHEGNHERDVTKIISHLRRKLNDSAKEPRYIRTVHGSGYMFLSER